MKVRNMTSPRSGQPVANQFIVDDGNGREYFQSYSTVIALREPCGGRLWLDRDYWDYSATTSKYRNQFTGLTTAETKAGIRDGSIKLVNLNCGAHK